MYFGNSDSWRVPGVGRWVMQSRDVAPNTSQIEKVSGKGCWAEGMSTATRAQATIRHLSIRSFLPDNQNFQTLEDVLEPGSK